MKQCTRCKEIKEFREFSKRKALKDGYQSHCKECAKSLYKQWTENPLYKDSIKDSKKARRKQSIVENHKKIYEFLATHPCVNCGESDPVVLDFDHLKNKKYDISYMRQKMYSWNALMKEISKCQILCANCHRRKTAKDQQWYKYFRN